MKTKFSVIFVLLIAAKISFAAAYPTHWWQEISDDQRQGTWEILPHEAKKGELILSKRNELGVFSNLAHTPFFFEDEHYASIEALWQMMKYPDLSDTKDPRNVIHDYPFTRMQVFSMHGFDAKHAGDAANEINKIHKFNFVTYKHHHFNYKDMKQGSQLHYKIIKSAIEAKVKQNPSIYKLLLKTKGLRLMPDHKQGTNLPKSYAYHEILMEIRDR